LVSYISMNLSVLILRIKEPKLPRAYKTPQFPILPIVSLGLAIISIFASVFTNITFFMISIGIFIVAIIYYFAWARFRINADAPEERISDIGEENGQRIS